MRIKKFVMSEAYKLSSFLSSPRKQRQFTSATNKLGTELSESIHLDLDQINKGTVEGLRFVEFRIHRWIDCVSYLRFHSSPLIVSALRNTG